MKERIQTLIVVAVIAVVALGACSSDRGPGSLGRELDQLTRIAKRVNRGHGELVEEYRLAEEDLAELELRHGVVPPTDKPRVRKLLLECFNVQVQEQLSDTACETLSSYTLDTLKAERSAEFAAVVDERLHRTALLRHRLKHVIPSKAESLADDYVRFQTRVRELRTIADSIYAAGKAYDAEETAQLRADYKKVSVEVRELEAKMGELESELNTTPARLRDMLLRTLQAITN